MLTLPHRQAASLRCTGHRPWPLPAAPWLMGQSWNDLLFAHWAVDPELLQPHIPGPLRIDTRHDRAWIAITPFALQGLHVRLMPPVPPLASFAELNVRTYVSCCGRPGLFFLTLDASSLPAVLGGRVLAGLPYRRAHVVRRRRGGWTEHASTRPGLAVRARYAGSGEAFHPPPGSLESFLVERYCLYTRRAGSIWRIDVHHRPWLLRRAATGSSIAVVGDVGAPLTGDPLLHVSHRQDVALWPPVRVAAR